ncbi:hypothetical protein SSS_01038 [Sarcoptes scabiei]|nr:hypothetical protein SSS_01038 [Sarcoptes scabiei]
MTTNDGVKRFETIPILNRIEVNDKIPTKISCIEVNADNLYVGTEDSFILFYENLLSLSSLSSSSSLNESTIKPFYKYLGIRKPIVKLKILPVLDRLLCICDKTLLSLDSASLELLNNLKIRNVQTFCQNQNPISDDPFQIELCLARSKSLEIVSIRSDRISVIKEVSVVEQPISVSMDGDYICMASPNHYFILNWQKIRRKSFVRVAVT